ncbi:MAG: phytoene/squalene synthase family protein [Thermoplasmata archaeon]|nr:MAG: phytoene/squalene synthase family protein [Thermoplasmata archaeon]
MIDRHIFSIFRKGSRTYFYNSLFFPAEIRNDVFTLYSFVRKADNYVDSKPQQPKKFESFKNRFYSALNGKPTGDVVTDRFAELHHRKKFRQDWTTAFIGSMETDLVKNEYETLFELEEYMYGSAEVIGLYMASVMELHKDALYYARHLGKAMQLVNFIRDIAEDIELNRTYLPKDRMKYYGLKSLDYEDTMNNRDEFESFVREQIGVYQKWQNIAEEGYIYIPRKYLIPVLNAAEMYKWTAKTINDDPYIVYERKVKPSIPRIVVNIGINAVTASSSPIQASGT